MEVLIDCWEWLKLGPELRVLGLYYLVAVLFAIIVHECVLTRQPKEEDK